MVLLNRIQVFQRLLPFRCADLICVVLSAPAHAALCLELKACAKVYKCSLQLCDHYNDTSYMPGSVRCNRGTGQCKGAARGTGNADNCYPNHFWASTLGNNLRYYEAYLNNGTYGTQSIPGTLAFSVRCVYGCKIQHTARAPP